MLSRVLHLVTTQNRKLKHRRPLKILTYLFLEFLITLNFDYVHHLARFLEFLITLGLEHLNFSSDKKSLVRFCIHTWLPYFRTKILEGCLSKSLGGVLGNITCIILGGHYLETRTMAALPCKKRKGAELPCCLGEEREPTVGERCVAEREGFLRNQFLEIGESSLG